MTGSTQVQPEEVSTYTNAISTESGSVVGEGVGDTDTADEEEGTVVVGEVMNPDDITEAAAVVMAVISVEERLVDDIIASLSAIVATATEVVEAVALQAIIIPLPPTAPPVAFPVAFPATVITSATEETRVWF